MFFRSVAYAVYKVGDRMSVCNRFTGLRCREVINACDGNRLGFVSDVEVDVNCGRIVSIIVPVPCRCFGLFGKHEDFVIPWKCIRRIGEDVILVEGDLDSFRLPRPRRTSFW